MNDGVRRFLAILLLAAFGTPLFAAAAAMGGDAESSLPACCRRTGAHHCAMTMGERANALSDAKRWQTPLERCPYCPASVAAVHVDPLHPPSTAQAIFAGFLSHPAGTPQTESRRRIARDRARQKRGPPPSFLL